MNERVALAVIGGTGHYDGPGTRVDMVRPSISRGQCSAPLEIVNVGDHRIAFLARHGPNHEYLPHEIDYVANLESLAELGVNTVIALNAVGGITSDVVQPGTLVVPDQIIDYTWGRVSTLGHGTTLMERHVEFAEPFNAEVREALIGQALETGVAVVDGGVYAVTQGPRLETAAEVERLARDGCNIVGMTAMPEAVLAREAGMRYAVLATVVNSAAGRGDAIIDEATIQAAQTGAATAMGKLLSAAVSVLSGD